jgi:NitT/TauT family transport system substrate-binding protein
MLRLERPTGVLLIALMLAGGLTARAADAPLQAVRVATVPADAGSEVYYAQKLGYFKNNGLDVTITGLANGSAVTSAVIGGSADIGQSNVVSLSQAHERGIPVVIIAGANDYRVTAQESGMVVAADSTIHTAKDLTGKTIGINGVRSIQEIGTDNWLDKNGGDSKTVKYLDLPFSAMADAVAAHRIDAAALTQPQLQAALDTQTVRQIADEYSAISDHFLLGGWFGMSPWVQAHPQVAVAFAKAIYQAAKWANAHQAESAAILEEATKVHMDRTDHRVPFAEGLIPGDVQKVIDVSAKYGILKSAFPATQIILAQ